MQSSEFRKTIDLTDTIGTKVQIDKIDARFESIDFFHTTFRYPKGSKLATALQPIDASYVVLETGLEEEGLDWLPV